MTNIPALPPLDSLADLEPDAAVGGAAQALRGIPAGGTPAQALRAAEMICRVWLAEKRGTRRPKADRLSPDREGGVYANPSLTAGARTECTRPNRAHTSSRIGGVPGSMGYCGRPFGSNSRTGFRSIPRLW